MTVMGDGTRVRPSILVDAAEWRMTEESIQALEARNDVIFRRSGSLVRVITDAYEKGGIKFVQGSPRIGPLPATILSEHLSWCARYYSIRFNKETKKKYERDEHPPSCTVQQVLARGHWPTIRPLVSVVEYPIIRPSGTILQEPGYDEETGILYLPSAEFERVPDNPTLEDAQHAITTLGELIQDFPFVQETHRAGWFAGAVTPVSRFSFDGCTPIFLTDAGAAGSGKSLLAKLIAAITTGREMPVMIPSDNEEEMRKRLFTLAIAGTRMVLLDNVTTELGGAALNGTITSRSIEDRLLGRNELATAPWDCIVYATANNCKVGDDTHRRTIYSRIEAQVERPEDRQGFKIPRLLEHAKEHRAKYMKAMLTILRAYAVYREQGGKKPDMHPMGSFEEWSDAVRAPLIWAGLPDPYAATTEWRDQTDTTAQSLGELLHGWKELCDTVGRSSLTAAQAISHLTEDERFCEAAKRDHHRDPEQPAPSLRWTTLRAALEPIAGGRPLPTSKQLGDLLSRSKSRVVGGLRLEPDGLDRNSKVVRWKVAILPGYRQPNGRSDGPVTEQWDEMN